MVKKAKKKNQSQKIIQFTAKYIKIVGQNKRSMNEKPLFQPLTPPIQKTNNLEIKV